MPKGKHSDNETEEKKMTKKEIAEIIESKATEYGFEIQRYPMGWETWQTNKSHVRIDINEMENEDKSDWDAHKIWLDLKAEGSICKMGGRNTPEELLKAAEEIAKGAKFAAEINGMELSYERAF